jgi:tetratricopeptide (TPR) repeat protein
MYLRIGQLQPHGRHAANLADLLKDQGDHARALPLFKRALAINEKALGPEHPLTATSLNNLAALLKDQGDYAGARGSWSVRWR